MLKGAWLLPIIMLIVLIVAAFAPDMASAADGSGPFKTSPQTFFKNLPGVKPQDEVGKAEDDPNAYRCKEGVGYVTGFRHDFGYPYVDTMPRRLYRCKANSGVTYTGTQMPNSNWVPGLNPKFLPE